MRCNASLITLFFVSTSPCLRISQVHLEDEVSELATCIAIESAVLLQQAGLHEAMYVTSHRTHTKACIDRSGYMEWDTAWDTACVPVQCMDMLRHQARQTSLRGITVGKLFLALFKQKSSGECCGDTFVLRSDADLGAPPSMPTIRPSGPTHPRCVVQPLPLRDQATKISSDYQQPNSM